MIGKFDFFMNNSHSNCKIVKVALVFSLVFILASCTTIKYDASRKPATMDKVHAGQNYTVLTHRNEKYFMQVTSIEKDSLVGLRQKERFSVATKDIRLIRKNNTVGTVILVGSLVSSAILVGVLSKNMVDVVRAVAPGP